MLNFSLGNCSIASREDRVIEAVGGEPQKPANTGLIAPQVRSSRASIYPIMYPQAGVLMASWNKILTNFDPHAFSHSQGQTRKSTASSGIVRFTPQTEVSFARSEKCHFRK